MEEFILFLDHTIDSKSMEQTVSRNLYKGVLVLLCFEDAAQGFQLMNYLTSTYA